jgi:pimeloyl-ACP methyl ester carboxylesterase
VTVRPILNRTLVADPGVRPRAWLLVLHGFFGAGRNWATVARRLTGARPEWGVVLADLRLHGASQGLAPPHTLEACADDLVALRDAAVPRADGAEAPVRAVLGHSFGGKVALTYLARHPDGVRQGWIVDADPSASAPRGGAWEMLRAVKALPSSFRTREDLVADLERSGFDRRTAEWMATNLERADDGYRWRLDFAALEALLRDFFQTDLWGVIERLPPDVDLHVVRATRSDIIPEASVSQLQAIGRATGRVAVDHVAGGHWLNADNPDALVALVAAGLPAA